MNEQTRYQIRKQKLKQKLDIKHLNNIIKLTNEKLIPNKIYVKDNKKYDIMTIKGTKEEFENNFSKEFLDKQIELGNLVIKENKE